VPAGDKAKCRRKKPGEVGQRETSTRLRWSEALKRAFDIDILQCGKCGGRLVMLAAVLDHPECARIVKHLAITEPELSDIESFHGPPVAFAVVDAVPEPWDLADDDPDAQLAA